MKMQNKEKGQYQTIQYDELKSYLRQDKDEEVSDIQHNQDITYKSQQQIFNNNTFNISAFNSLKTLTPIQPFNFQPRVMTQGGYPTIASNPPRDISKMKKKQTQVNQLQQKFSNMISEIDIQSNVGSSVRNLNSRGGDPFQRALFQDHFEERKYSLNTTRTLNVTDKKIDLKKQFDKNFDMKLPEIRKGKSSNRGIGLKQLLNQNIKSPKQQQLSTCFRAVYHQGQIKNMTDREIKAHAKNSGKKELAAISHRTINVEDLSSIRSFREMFRSDSTSHIQEKQRVITPDSAAEIVITQNDYVPTEETIMEERITGVNRNKYLFKKDDFQGMMSFLAQLTKARKKSDIIEKNIQKAAKECGLDPEQIVKEIQKLLEKKIQLNDANNLCPIHQMADEFKRYGKSYKPNFLSKGYKCCQHTEAREDLILDCIREYKKLLDFKRKLMGQLQDEPSDEEIITFILEKMKNDEINDKQQRKYFKDEESIRKILDDPLQQIVESQEIFNQELKRQIGQSMYEKSKVTRSLSIYQTQQQQVISPSAASILKTVSGMISEENFARIKSPTLIEDSDKSEEELRRLLAIQLLTANVKKPSGFSLKSSGSNGIQLSDLIIENISRYEKMIENDTGTLDVEMLQSEMAKKEMINVQVLYRIKASQRVKEHQVEFSYGFKNPEEMQTCKDEDQRKYEVGGYDEVITVASNEYVEKRNKYIEQINKIDNQLITRRMLRMDTELSYQSDQVCLDEHLKPFISQNIFNEIDQKLDFFQAAKQEIHGNHLPSSQESQFYIQCQKQGILANPVYKSIKNNCLVLNNEKVYCEALSKMIVNNEDPSKHILELSINSCSLKDNEFAIILQAIKNTTQFETSVQIIQYKDNNEIGEKSFQSLIQLLKMQILKKLVIQNVQVRSMKEIRYFFEEFVNLSNHGLQQMVLEQISLNDSQIISNLCTSIENNNKLRKLTLSNCNLSAQQLIKVLKAVIQNFNIESLNLSNNAVSELKENNQIYKAEFVHFLAKYLNENNKIQNLDISGLLLGKVLLYLLPFLKQSESLIEVNFSNNLISDQDLFYITNFLGIYNKPDIQSYFLANDNYFSSIWSFFKQNHLNEHFDMNKKEQVNKKYKKSTEKVYESVINGGILKNIQKQPKDVLASTIHKNIGLNSFNQFIFKRLSMSNKEMVFNQLYHDKFNTFDFSKNSKWQYNGNGIGDTSNLQNVVVVIQKEGFIQIKDTQLLSLLKTQYGFKPQKGQYKENPVIFGSATNWDAYQSIKLYQFCLILATKNKNERQILISHLFDENNYNLTKDFKTTSVNILPIFQKYIKSKNSLLIGKSHQDFDRFLDLKTIDKLFEKDFFVFATYLPVGKHSIFYYDPAKDEFYTKIIVVQPIKEQFVRDYTELCQEIQIQNNQKNTHSLEFISDLKIVDLSSYFSQKNDFQEALACLEENYTVLQNLFYELQSESQDSYPLVSHKDLQRFSEQTGLKYSGEYKLIDRAQFIKFIVHSKKGKFQDYIKNVITPLVVKRQEFKNAEIHRFNELNRFNIHVFLTSHHSGTSEKIWKYLDSLSMKYVREQLIKPSGIPISDFNCNKFFALSVKQKSEMFFDEFVEFVYRISNYVFDPENYEEVPIEIEKLMGESQYVKYRETMAKILGKEVIENDEEIRAENDITQYIQENLREQFIARAKFFE